MSRGADGTTREKQVSAPHSKAIAALHPLAADHATASLRMDGRRVHGFFNDDVIVATE
jgi:hypothetical protein